jgi:hypothetical protein
LLPHNATQIFPTRYRIDQVQNIHTYTTKKEWSSKQSKVTAADAQFDVFVCFRGAVYHALEFTLYLNPTHARTHTHTHTHTKMYNTEYEKRGETEKGN